MDMALDGKLPTTSPRFWDRIAAKYARQPIADEEAYQHKLRVTQSYMRPDMNVLEFGCGTGGTALIHADHVAQIKAIDFSEKMIEIAREKAWNASAPNVDFDVAAIEHLPDSDGPFDMILGMSILHLVADVPGVLAKVNRLMPDGGLFISSTVCMKQAGWPMRLFFLAGRALRVFPPVQFFDKAELIGMLERAGFEIEHQWSQSGKLSGHFLVARKVA